MSKFDDWSELKDCNNCKHYWDDSCDGVLKGKNRLCTSFLATKRLDIPLQIKRLQRSICWLKWTILILIVLHIVTWIY